MISPEALMQMRQGEYLKPMPPGRRVTVHYTLFDSQAIRDVNVHFPSLLIALARAVNWGFEVDNKTDKAVTVTLIGGGSGSPAGAGNVGLSATIAANTKEPVVSDTWMPWLGLKVQFGTIPTTGTLSIEGFAQEVM